MAYFEESATLLLMPKLAKVLSGAILGLESTPVTIEVNIDDTGFPGFTIVGLADKAVEESKERVRSAIKSCGLEFPRHRLVVNLTPADLPKKGALFDLPIALGIIIASGIIDVDVSDALFFGELSLDGELRFTPGAISLGMLARKLGLTKIYLPEVNAIEAAFIPEIKSYGVKTLKDVVAHLQENYLEPVPTQDFKKLLEDCETFLTDFGEVRGQDHAKRGLEIAAAGGHNIAMKGPPGSGKTMLARSIPSILPKLTPEEAFEVTKIYSVTGNLPQGSAFMKSRPFRSPHHTTSRIGLIGGGSHPTPGEISLAHRGVLFLDEFPELDRSTLEALRQPLEDGMVSVSRAAGTLTFPCRFILVVASNPCPCGNKGAAGKKCICTQTQIDRYKKRVSGPILDRIDIHVEVPAVEFDKLVNTGDAREEEMSLAIRERVQRARAIQDERFKNLGITCNAEMSSKLVKQFCELDEAGTRTIKNAVSSMGLSARGYFRVLKVARTIADLKDCEKITEDHLAEALQYRVQTT